MKTLMKTIATATLLSSALVSQAALAEQKIGVVDARAVFSQLPQAAVIQTTVREEFKDQLEEIARLEKDMSYYMEKAQRDAATMSEKEKEELGKKVMELRKDYQAKAQPLQEAMQRRGSEEQNKVMKMIKDAVDKLAAEEKYDVILNANAVIFIDDAHNLSQKVADRVSNAK